MTLKDNARVGKLPMIALFGDHYWNGVERTLVLRWIKNTLVLLMQ